MLETCEKCNKSLQTCLQCVKHVKICYRHAETC